ncbi:hypothetical protein GCK32_010735, partial [Trichostrongylus colubriformis]
MKSSNLDEEMSTKSREKEVKKSTAKEQDKVSLPVLFRYATKLDFCLMIVGAVLAAIQGTLNSVSSLIFRHLLDALIIGEFEWGTGIFDDYEFTQLAMKSVYSYSLFGVLQFTLGFLS